MIINKKIQKTTFILFIAIGLVLIMVFLHILPNKILISTYTNGFNKAGWSLRKIDTNSKDISELQNIISNLPADQGRFCPLDEGAGYSLYFYTFPFIFQYDFASIQGCGDVRVSNNDLKETNYAFWKFFYTVIPSDLQDNKGMLNSFSSN